VSAPAAAVVLVAVLAAGCGSENGSEDGAGTSPDTSLEITVTGGGADERWTLTCDPTGGTHPDPEEACATLHEHHDALEEPPADVVCTQQYGGPQEAVIEGTLSGDRYTGSFHRRDGCGISRWEQLQPLLVVQGGA
jgi:Subtilisin inhibitor-like